MVVREVDWLELPDHLTTFVTDKLSRCDFIRFGAVCKSWLSVYTKHRRHSLPHQIPLLLLETKELGVHDIFELGENRVSTFQVSVPRCVPCTGACCGSNYGWMVSVWRASHQFYVSLSNPFLSEDTNINLPPLRGERYSAGDLKKLALSADPASDLNFVVMVILKRRKLAFIKPATDETDWTYLDTQSELIDDIVYYRNQFYFVDTSGALFACDLNYPGDPPKLFLVASPPYSTFGHHYDGNKNLHLVELLSGELLLIKRLSKYTKNELPFYTLGFLAFKMYPLVECKWIEVHDLCGETVFLDDYSSLSIRASEFPECKPNCIHFIENGYLYRDRSGVRPHDRDDYHEDYCGIEPYYVGVFNLEDEIVIERRCPLENPTWFSTDPPFWIEPKLLRHR